MILNKYIFIITIISLHVNAAGIVIENAPRQLVPHVIGSVLAVFPPKMPAPEAFWYLLYRLMPWLKTPTNVAPLGESERSKTLLAEKFPEGPGDFLVSAEDMMGIANLLYYEQKNTVNGELSDFITASWSPLFVNAIMGTLKKHLSTQPDAGVLSITELAAGGGNFAQHAMENCSGNIRYRIFERSTELRKRQTEALSNLGVQVKPIGDFTEKGAFDEESVSKIVICHELLDDLPHHIVWINPDNTIHVVSYVALVSKELAKQQNLVPKAKFEAFSLQQLFGDENPTWNEYVAVPAEIIKRKLLEKSIDPSVIKWKYILVGPKVFPDVHAYLNSYDGFVAIDRLRTSGVQRTAVCTKLDAFFENLASHVENGGFVLTTDYGSTIGMDELVYIPRRMDQSIEAMGMTLGRYNPTVRVNFGVVEDYAKKHGFSVVQYAKQNDVMIHHIAMLTNEADLRIGLDSIYASIHRTTGRSIDWVVFNPLFRVMLLQKTGNPHSEKIVRAIGERHAQEEIKMDNYLWFEYCRLYVRLLTTMRASKRCKTFNASEFQSDPLVTLVAEAFREYINKSLHDASIVNNVLDMIVNPEVTTYSLKEILANLQRLANSRLWPTFLVELARYEASLRHVGL